jgi:hypothetical protein
MGKQEHKQMTKPDADRLISITNFDPNGNRIYHSIIKKGAIYGAVTGGILMGIVGYLLADGTWAIEGLGQMAAGGNDAATFFGFTVGSALGGLTGSLVGMYQMFRMPKS